MKASALKPRNTAEKEDATLHAEHQNESEEGASTMTFSEKFQAQAKTLAELDRDLKILWEVPNEKFDSEKFEDFRNAKLVRVEVAEKLHVEAVAELKQKLQDIYNEVLILKLDDSVEFSTLKDAFGIWKKRVLNKIKLLKELEQK